MRFVMEFEVEPACSTCKFCRFSNRIDSDTIYCVVSGKKELAIEPCHKYFVYSFSDDICGRDIKHIRTFRAFSEKEMKNEPTSP